MSAIALRARVRRRRRHAVLAPLLLALTATVALHHAAPAIGAAHEHPETVALAAMCLGVVTAVGAAVAVVLALLAPGRWRPAILLDLPGVPRIARLPQPRSRAGPASLAHDIIDAQQREIADMRKHLADAGEPDDTMQDQEHGAGHSG